MTKSAWCAAALGLALWGCEANPKSETTTTTFDALQAMQDCKAARPPAATPQEEEEINGLVTSQRLAPQDCAEFAEMLEMIRETDSIIDESLAARDYHDPKEVGQ